MNVPSRLRYLVGARDRLTARAEGWAVLAEVADWVGEKAALAGNAAERRALRAGKQRAAARGWGLRLLRCRGLVACPRPGGPRRRRRRGDRARLASPHLHASPASRPVAPGMACRRAVRGVERRRPAVDLLRRGRYAM